MQLVFDSRASSILYLFLLENKGSGKWMIPTNVCHFIPACFIKSNCPFEIIDVNLDTLRMCDKEVISRLVKDGRNYSGILTVRNFGEEYPQISFFNKIKKLAPHIKIIDDACLSYPNFNSTILHQVDLELYSTGYSKPVDIGYGGFGKIHDNQKKIIPKELNFDEKRLIQMNNAYKNSLKNSIGIQQTNFKTNWLLSKKINQKEYINKVNLNIAKSRSHREKINNTYDKYLNPSFKEIRLSTNWRYNIRLSNPLKVLEKIFEEGLFASQHYYPLNLAFKKGICSNWENVYKSMLNLFNDYRFSDLQAKKCCQIINSYAKVLNS
tara:strand:+ start:5347 stop:6315 length:969 start_codon:yes stop_codon:yes gene_type:complete